MTAVELLIEQITSTYRMHLPNWEFPNKEYFIEMEKQQIIDAYKIDVDEWPTQLSDRAEQYYNETYGSDETKNNNIKQETIKEVFDTIVPIKKLTIDELLKEYGENLTESEVKILKQVLNGIENK